MVNSIFEKIVFVLMYSHPQLLLGIVIVKVFSTLAFLAVAASFMTCRSRTRVRRPQSRTGAAAESHLVTSRVLHASSGDFRPTSPLHRQRYSIQQDVMQDLPAAPMRELMQARPAVPVRAMQTQPAAPVRVRTHTHGS